MQLNLDLDQSEDMPEKSIAGNPQSTPKPRPFYPSFHHEGTVDWEDAGITDEGTMTIRYCITRSTETNHEGEDERYSYDVEVREILSVAPEKDESPSKSYGKDSENALDALAAKLAKKME
jgi:hypothetical protein